LDLIEPERVRANDFRFGPLGEIGASQEVLFLGDESFERAMCGKSDA